MELSNSTVIKTPEAESEPPSRIQLPAAAKPSPPFTNGVLKRHPPPPPPPQHHPIVITYKECLKNHAAALGGHALDGCGEFMPSPASNPADPTSLKCAACGCHRNFHRRDPDEPFLLLTPPPSAAPALEFRPHHRHHPPPPPPPRGNNSGGSSSPDDNSPSPPPISSAYYPTSAPHMLLALSHGHHPPDGGHTPISAALLSSGGSRKRFRTKFTQNQKEKMLEFAEKLGWKMQRRDEDVINGFCGEIGVDKGVFKVWMHNNKNTFGKKDNSNNLLPEAAATNGGGIGYNDIGAAAEGCHYHHQQEEKNDSKENVHHVQKLSPRPLHDNRTNGSSSS